MYLEELNLVSDTNYKVYTPEPIARKMISSILKEYFDNYKANKKEALENIRACDLACGTGNLLIVLIETLIKISKIYYKEYKYNENWVEGYDIDADALEIFQERFKELMCKYKLEGNLNIFNKNSLLEDFDKSYNILIGNPPYLGEKNNREIFDNIKNTEFGKKYYEGRMDYLYFFIIKGIDILEKNGILSYITTNYWLRADYAKTLREKIARETDFIYIKNYNKSVFKNVHGQHNIIFTFVKAKINRLLLVEDEKDTFCIENNYIFDVENKIVLACEKKRSYFEKILNKKNYYLGELLNINQGIVSGCDKAFILNEYKSEFSEFLKPFYKNSQISKYRVDKNNLYWILYLTKDSKPNSNILEHLQVYREKLEKRREVQKKYRQWWELQWARDKEIFTNLKIVSPQRAVSNTFSMVEGEFYASADIYYLSPKRKDIDLYYILAYLNSKVFYEWFKYNGKNKGAYLELYATPLKNTPIYYPDDKKEISRISKLSKELSLNYKKEVEEEIDRYFFEMYNSSN